MHVSPVPACRKAQCSVYRMEEDAHSGGSVTTESLASARPVTGEALRRSHAGASDVYSLPRCKARLNVCARGRNPGIEGCRVVWSHVRVVLLRKSQLCDTHRDISMPPLQPVHFQSSCRWPGPLGPQRCWGVARHSHAVRDPVSSHRNSCSKVHETVVSMHCKRHPSLVLIFNDLISACAPCPQAAAAQGPATLALRAQ